jgi:histone H3/H4
VGNKIRVWKKKRVLYINMSNDSGLDQEMRDVQVQLKENAEQDFNNKGESLDEEQKEQDDNMEPESAKLQAHPISLPLARVKRIMKQDDEIVTVSSGAVIAVAAATELFVQYLTEQALLVARGEKHKKLTYNDFANAVARVEQLEFLSGLVPKTIPYKKVLERKQAAKDAIVLPGQTTLKAENGKLTAVPQNSESEVQQPEGENHQEVQREGQPSQPIDQKSNQNEHPTRFSHSLSNSQPIEVGEYEVLPQHLNPAPPPPPPQQIMQPIPGMHVGVPPQGLPPQGYHPAPQGPNFAPLGQPVIPHNGGIPLQPGQPAYQPAGSHVQNSVEYRQM